MLYIAFMVLTRDKVYWKQLAPSEKLEVCQSASGMSDEEMSEFLNINTADFRHIRRNLKELPKEADKSLFRFYRILPDTLTQVKMRGRSIASRAVRRRTSDLMHLIKDSNEKLDSQMLVMVKANKIAYEMYNTVRSDERLLKGMVSVRVSSIFGQKPAYYSVSYVVSGNSDCEATLRVGENTLEVLCLGRMRSSPIMRRREFPMNAKGVDRAIRHAKTFILSLLGLRTQY